MTTIELRTDVIAHSFEIVDSFFLALWWREIVETNALLLVLLFVKFVPCCCSDVF